jgi:hypothetical protein
MRAGTINSVSYEVLNHIRRVLRYGRDHEVVNFLIYQQFPVSLNGDKIDSIIQSCIGH